MTTLASSQEPHIQPNLRQPARGGDRMAIAGFGLLVVLTVVYIMHKGAGNTFFFDEWGWIETKRSGLHAIVASDNGHMLILQSALYELLFHTVGLNHYWVFRAVGVASHVILLITMFVFARRRIGAPAALIVLIPIAFLGSGWQFDLWGAAGSGFLLSIAFFLMAQLALESETARGDIWACVLLVIALGWSDYTLAFLVGIAIELLWRTPRLRQVWIWGVPLVLYLCWYAVYHQAQGVSLRDNLTAAPSFGLDSMAASAAGLFGADSTWAAPLGAVLIVGLGWRILRVTRVEPRLVALIVAGGGYWTLLGLGRAQLSDPSASRYVYVGAVFIVLIAVEAMRTITITMRLIIVGVVVSLIALAGNIRAFDDGEGILSASSVQVQAELGALSVAQRTAPAGLVLDAHFAPQIVAGEWLAATKALHSTAADSVRQLLAAPESARAAADTTLVAAGALSISSAPSPSPRAPVAPSVQDARGGSVHRGHDCVTFAPTEPGSFIDLDLPPTGIVITASGAATASAQARRFAAGFENAALTTVSAASAGVEVRPVPDHSSLPWFVRITPQGGSVRICTVG
jgi:hypothetical protein